FEILIARLVVEHHHADHVENISALGIDEAPGYVRPSARVIGAVSHGQWAQIDGAKTLSIFFQQQLALVIPELDYLLRVFLDHADIEGRGHIRESLAHPLV